VALCAVAPCSIASAAAALDAPDHCIVGDNAIGCRSVRALAMLTDGFRGNGDALHREIESQIDSGTCRLFEYGERVYSTDIEGGLRSAVRRPRDASTWFMPASWSRPASECDGTSTPQALQQKLGLAESPRREPDSRSNRVNDPGRIRTIRMPHVPGRTPTGELTPRLRARSGSARTAAPAKTAHVRREGTSSGRLAHRLLNARARAACGPSNRRSSVRLVR
jgi:hypothetical protein